MHNKLCPDRIQENWATCWTCGIINTVLDNVIDVVKPLGMPSDIPKTGFYLAGAQDALRAIEKMKVP